MDSKKLNKLFPNKFLYGLLSILFVGQLAYGYNILFSETISEALQLQHMAPEKKIVLLLIRGMSISGFYYFIIHSLHVSAEKQKHELEIEQLKQIQLQANLSSLKEQISPHFLFNTLNTLSTLTQEVMVKDYINELANVYRYVLQYKDENIASLKQELSFIESYLYIIKTRLEDSIEISVNVEHNMWNSKIPPLTLQLLIENAIKHNIAAAHHPLKIKIYTENNYLIVQNNFQPKRSVTHSTGKGLENITQRYQLIFNHEIYIEKRDDVFLVKLPIIIE
ncbi:histidine kinase [Fluviicola taffensis]|uniref:sensor histidine kinase n=1 Tax=Fluviicola taffensis TaxID=191579 RepID=UPI003137F533